MRPSSYHDRNRYVNKPVIINNTTSQSPPDSLLPRARIINTSTPSILRPTIRHSSYYYQPAIIRSRNNRSSYSSSYHHRNNNNNNYSRHNNNKLNSYHRTRNRGRIHSSHHSHNRRYDDKLRSGNRDRSRSRNRDKRYKSSNNIFDKNKNKSILDNRFSSNTNTNHINESSKLNANKSKVIELRNAFANKYQLTMNKYYNEIIVNKLNNYYNNKLNPRFMIQNDDKFRNRIERLKGLHAYPLNDFMDEFDDNKTSNNKNEKKSMNNNKKPIKNDKLIMKNNRRNNDKKSLHTNKKKGDKNSIFSSKGKSSMNYKFRAFKKSSQPNSFVQSAQTMAGANNNKIAISKYNNNKYHGGNNQSCNIHVNDNDIYIDRNASIDMNELINGLVYSREYQDHRIGTLNTAQNDYSQYFVDTRQRPSNFIRELQHQNRLKEYPKLRKLMQSKNEALRKISCLTPPFYIHTDLKTFDLLNLQCKFDVILVDPPWKFYNDRCPGYVNQNANNKPWTFDEMSNLRIQDIAENPSFLFLWSGSGTTLNDARLLLKKWGYKRCEVIVWLKTNKKNKISITCANDGDVDMDDNICNYLLEKTPNEYDGSHYNDSLFVRSYEHCLMGIRGQVRRSTDGHLIHANVDTDVIITESAPYGSQMKPKELYDIIERFCLGRKRVELFGCKHNLRPGWVTISNDDGIPVNSNYDPTYYNSLFNMNNQTNQNQNSNQNNMINARYVPSTNEIEALRPKSPIRNNQKNMNKNKINSMTRTQSK